MTPGWKCPRRIGFLFPHACTRLSPEGCPDCQNGEVSDPYTHRSDRGYYTSYDYYDDSVTGYALESVAGGFDPGFTEADGEALESPDDSYEDDASAS